MNIPEIKNTSATSEIMEQYEQKPVAQIQTYPSAKDTVSISDEAKKLSAEESLKKYAIQQWEADLFPFMNKVNGTESLNTPGTAFKPWTQEEVDYSEKVYTTINNVLKENGISTLEERYQALFKNPEQNEKIKNEVYKALHADSSISEFMYKNGINV